MIDTADQRKYQRSDHATGRATVSIDGKHWEAAEICDLSAGGLRFTSPTSYKIDTKLVFTLSIYNLLSEFKLRFEGQIVRCDEEHGECIYAVKFININPYDQVQLDEIVKSCVTVKAPSDWRHQLEDGSYSFLFRPAHKSGRFHMRR